jgi:plasmid stabilization system protein ParE
MAKLIWSPRALADLRGICDYIARDSERYASLFAERIVALVESIPEHPLLGAVVPLSFARREGGNRNAGTRRAFAPADTARPAATSRAAVSGPACSCSPQGIWSPWAFRIAKLRAIASWPSACPGNSKPATISPRFYAGERGARASTRPGRTPSLLCLSRQGGLVSVALRPENAGDVSQRRTIRSHDHGR